MSNPPPYAPAPQESKGIYPSVPPEPQQQQPGGYYPQQPGGQQYPPSQQQQQPQQFVVTQGAPVVVTQRPPPQSFIAHIILSCVVFWCCGCLCGLIAFILAMVAQGQATTSPSSARQYGIGSIVLSVIGIAIGIIILIIVIILYVTAAATVASIVADAEGCPYHYVDGACYRDREFESSLSACSGYFKDDWCYSNKYY